MRIDMDYETLIENLVYWSKASHVNPRSRYALGKAANAITDLLVENQSLRNAANGFKARAVSAEARAEKAERERDEAISDLTWAVNEYRRLTTETDLCGLCKYDLPPAGENGKTYECPGFCKDDCFKWRGQKEE